MARQPAKASALAMAMSLEEEPMIGRTTA